MAKLNVLCMAARVSPCWSGSALRDTMALIAGKVMLDMAATAPAAHIILKGKINHQTLTHTDSQSVSVHVHVELDSGTCTDPKHTLQRSCLFEF